MRWLPFIAIFLYVYIEISIFIQVAHVLGVLLTLVLVIFTSVIGMSLVRNQGFKNFVLMQQKMAAGENPAAVKLMPHLRFSRMPGGGFSAGTGGGNTFDGEYQRKDDDRDRLDHKDDRQD